MWYKIKKIYQWTNQVRPPYNITDLDFSSSLNWFSYNAGTWWGTLLSNQLWYTYWYQSAYWWRWPSSLYTGTLLKVELYFSVTNSLTWCWCWIWAWADKNPKTRVWLSQIDERWPSWWTTMNLSWNTASSFIYTIDLENSKQYISTDSSKIQTLSDACVSWLRDLWTNKTLNITVLRWNNSTGTTTTQRVTRAIFYTR
jgi:hypothetical protein